MVEMTDAPPAEPEPPEVPPVVVVPREREATFSDAVILLLVFLAAQLVLGLAAGLVTGAMNRRIDNLILAGIEAVSLAALVPVLRGRLGHRLAHYVRYAPVRVGSWCAVILCCVGLILGLRQVEGLVLRVLPITHFWRTVFGQITGTEDFARGIILAALVAPVVEEIIFRGILLRGFAAHYGRARGVLYSSLLFGLAHANPWQFVPALVLGFFLGALYLRTRTVVPTIVAHALYNGSLMVLSQFARTRAIVDTDYSAGMTQAVLITLTVTGVLIFCLGFWLLLRSSRPAPAAG
jgi:membrane protease YdiL (CAAX protease family)